MNKFQKIILGMVFVNLVVIFLYPPYDEYPLAQNYMPAFSGFRLLFDDHPRQVINSSLLYLEVFVVLINGGIAWLLLNNHAASVPRRLNRQEWTLVAVAVNLILILLFPPFENAFVVSHAVLPTFDGFYFIFGDNSRRSIVSPMLYLELVFILVNGALFWLFLRHSDPMLQDLTPDQDKAMASALKQVSEGKSGR
jgi:hypothetical protein